MKQTGMFWHEYHDFLCGYCCNYDKRVEYIKHHKREHERALRLRLFQPIKSRLPCEFIKAHKKCAKASQKYNKTWQKHVKQYTWRRYAKTWQKYIRARQKYAKVWQKYKEIRQKYEPEIKALHAKECPNCSWNGTKIVFPEVRK